MTGEIVSPALTVERLRELLEYDPIAGVFRNRVGRKGTLGVGAIAGGPECRRNRTNPSGCEYWYICIDRRKYKRSRLAWLYVNGHWPSGEVDHFDGVENNDAIGNLRDSTRLQNSQNTRIRKHNKVGLKGVRYVEKRPDLRKRWHARITVAGKEVCVGYYMTERDAAEAYDAAALRHHGEFARTNRMMGLLG